VTTLYTDIDPACGAVLEARVADGGLPQCVALIARAMAEAERP